MLAQSLARSARSLFAAACIAALALSFSAKSAHAQSMDAQTHPISADLKGMIGMGLLGGELGLVIPALAGLRETWAFIVFPVAGAAGGAVGGYFLLEKGDGHPELAVASLTAGMALFIPAMIVTLTATAYEPEESVAPAALVRVSDEGLALSAPAVSVTEAASAREALRTGAGMAREVRVSLVSGAF